MSVEGSLRCEAEEVQNFYAGGTRSQWYFLVSWLFLGASQLMEDALCWMSSTVGAFGLALFGVSVLPGLRRISSGFDRLSLFGVTKRRDAARSPMVKALAT